MDRIIFKTAQAYCTNEVFYFFSRIAPPNVCNIGHQEKGEDTGVEPATGGDEQLNAKSDSQEDVVGVVGKAEEDVNKDSHLKRDHGSSSKSARN